jgi:outer membrane protein assembly factor BamB
VSSLLKRSHRLVWALALVVSVMPLVFGGDLTAAGSSATGFGSDWTVYHDNGLGTGVDPAGTDLTPLSKAWTSQVLDGQLYGEPLVDDGMVFVATENDTVYALAANTGAVVWSKHLATPVPSSNLPCGDITPTVGITSTPVIDPSSGEIFVVDDQLTKTGGASHHLVGLDAVTGAVTVDEKVDPTGSFPLYQLQRPALALDQGRVIVGYGGNSGDCESGTSVYHGWLVSVPESGGPMDTFEVSSLSGDSQGAIWMGGAAPVVDSNGNIWVATGNGAFSSSTDAYDDSDGVLELTSSLKLKGYFAPSHWYKQNGNDQDLGSSSPAIMSDGFVLQAGKNQTAYVLSASDLGGVGGQEAQSPAGSFCGSDVDGGNAISNDSVYSPCESGVVKTRVKPSAGNGPPTITVVWQTSTGSGGPAIIAGGLVWTIDQSGKLYGLDPNTGAASVTRSIGSVANHFPTPTVADGLLLAPATSQVYAFDGPGGLPPAPSP